MTIYDRLTHTQISPERAGSTKYKDRRLLALYFDMTAMQPEDQLRALSAAKAFIQISWRRRSARHSAIRRQLR